MLQIKIQSIKTLNLSFNFNQKYMKVFFCISFCLIISLFHNVNAQKKEKEPKINYKLEILPLLQNAKVDEAIPLLKKYYSQNVVLGDIWKPKVMLLEVEYMHNTEKLIAVDYDSKAFKNYSVQLADTSIIWYKRMLMDSHPDSLFAKERLSNLMKSKVEFPAQLAAFEKQKEIDDSKRKKFFTDSLEQARITTEKREVFIKDSTENANKIQQELTDYNFVKSQKEIEQFKAFLRKYPESEYYFEMDTLCSNLAYSKAEETNSFLGYKNFIDSFPNSNHKNSAVEKIVKISSPRNVSSLSKLADVNTMISQIRKLNNDYSLGLIFPSNQFATNDINSHYWTYKNLNVSHFANGDTIPQAKTNQEWVKAANDKKPAWCYIQSNTEDSYNKGKLYNWYAINDVRGLSAYPFFIPIQEDFENMVSSIGSENNPAQKLKCPFSWEELEDIEEIEGNLNFDATPTGYRDQEGNFIGIGQESRFWSTSEDGNSAKYFGLKKNETNCDMTSSAAKGCGFSVRLVSFERYNEYSISPTLDSLFNKVDELLLKEYSLIKDETKVKPFLFKQIKNEFGIKHLKEEEINQVNLQLLLQRFYTNETLVKNGSYLVPSYYADNMICGAGDGYGGGFNPEIIHGFSNNTQNYIKWENGATYKGDIVNGFPNGKGVYVTGNDLEMDEPGGDVYEGDYVDGIMTYGTIKYKDKRIYVGQCNEEQLPHGQGTMTLANGTKQTGQFIEGVYQKGFECKSSSIGNQIWMAENLSVTKFRNGDPIPQVVNSSDWVNAGENKQPAFCYVENNSSNSSSYGIIYNWFAVVDPRGLAPEGWRIPDINDFNTLKNFCQPEITEKNNEIESKRGQGIDVSNLENDRQKLRDSKSVNGIRMASIYLPGYKLKSKTGWINQLDKKSNWNGNNKFNFNILPTYKRSYLNGMFYFDNEIDAQANFWLSTSFKNQNAAAMRIDYKGDLFIQGFDKNQGEIIGDDKGQGYPVRCIKN
jgi:uncharacterized protein (TIGR02145 family)